MSNDTQNIRNSIVALVTPFHEDGRLDFDALSRLVEWHIEQGTDCLAVTGTTGESSTLDHHEHIDVISHCIRCVRDSIPIVAGTGSNSTDECIKLSKGAWNVGASACLQVTPYYNLPSQEGLYRHYQTVANAVPIPHILYNVPKRTGVDLLPSTLLRLAEIKNIIGLKEANGQLERIDEVKRVVCTVRPDFLIYAGEDSIAFEILKKGGVGSVSVTANVVPNLVHQMCQLARDGQWTEARQVNQRIDELNQALFVETNPVPTKWALRRMGRIEGGIRLPLVPLASKHHPRVTAALTQVGIQLD